MLLILAAEQSLAQAWLSTEMALLLTCFSCGNMFKSRYINARAVPCEAVVEMTSINIQEPLNNHIHLLKDNQLGLVLLS
jgi:hypothetical protein